MLTIIIQHHSGNDKKQLDIKKGGQILEETKLSLIYGLKN